MKKNFNHRILLLIGFAVAFTSLYAAVPRGYYDSVNGKTDQALKTGLHNILMNHTRLNYNNLWKYFNATDVHPDGTVWEMYSDQTFYFNGDKAIDGINREHSFPKSWWGTSDDAPKYAAYSDLNHLYPAEAKANNSKSNNILGVVGGTINFDNGVSKIGTNVFDYTGSPSVKCFEPADEYKGDFARTYMYMVTCYEDYANQWRAESLNMLTLGETYPMFQEWSKEMLLEWSRNDPVSQKELDRNEAVFKFQNNRNPFIDFPQLAEYIWGDSIDHRFQVPDSDIAIDAVLVSPTQGTNLYFGEVKPGEELTMTLNIRGIKMINSLTLWLYDVDLGNPFAKYFQLSATSIPAELVNTEDGFPLEIKYTPTEIGEHTAGILIYGGGLDGSENVTVTLNGVCTENPNLSVPIGSLSPDIYVSEQSIWFRTYDVNKSPVQIYNVYGNLLYSSRGSGEWTEYRCNEPGIYIVRINNKTKKVIIK
ncbi:MAG: endonuclease [Candidatus Azobacteroides sp.]|nr:endonuclease [Candidatus Azobacteroides sp.]